MHYTAHNGGARERADVCARVLGFRVWGFRVERSGGYGGWLLGYGKWLMVDGLWFMVYGSWIMVYG